jgi:hypothetical protein
VDGARGSDDDKADVSSYGIVLWEMAIANSVESNDIEPVRIEIGILVSDSNPVI